MLAQFCNFHTVVFAHATLNLVEHGFYRSMGSVLLCMPLAAVGGLSRCAERRSVAVVLSKVGEVTPRAAVWCRTLTSDYCVGYNVQDVFGCRSSAAAAVPNTSVKSTSEVIKPLSLESGYEDRVQIQI